MHPAGRALLVVPILFESHVRSLFAMAMQRETDASGQLRYLAGSIAIHVLDREFVRRTPAGA